MKKTLKFTGIFMAIVLVLMIFLPFAFRGKVSGIIQDQANKNLLAKVTFTGLNLNLFTNFPKITATLSDLTIAGVDSFAQDTNK